MSLEFFGHALRSFFSSRAAEPPRSVGVDVFPGIGDPWPLNGEDDEMAEELARMQERIVELETAASGAGQLRLELDRSRRRLFEIAESISDGLFVLDREWKYRYANERAAQLVARSRDDLIGSCIWDILSAAEHFQLSAEAHRAMEERVPVQVETYSRPLGIWFEAHLYPFSDGLVCYARDITDRKRSEAETGRLAAIVTFSTDAIVAKTLDGTITVWNPAAQLLYGYSVEEAVGRSIALIVPPERSVELDWIMEQVGRGERVVLPETVRRRKDGSLIDVAVSVSPILDQAGQVVGAAAITRDVRERKRTEAERALLLAHEREMRARATQLQTLTAALAGATTEAEVIDVILTHGVASLGAQTGVICFLADDGTALELARAVGYVPAELARWARIPLTDPSPRAEVARTGQPVWVDSWDCLTSRYPDTARSFATAFEATAMLPLKVDGKTVGVLGFHFPDPQPFSTADRGFLLTLAAQCAQALHRARMYQAATRATARAETLADTARELAAAFPDTAAMLACAARRAAELIGDGCAIQLDAGPAAAPVLVEVTHRDPEARRLARAAIARISELAEDLAAEEGEPVALRDLSPSDYDRLFPSAYRPYLERYAIHSLLAIGLRARGQPVGTVVVWRDGSPSPYGADDQQLLAKLTDLVALLIDNVPRSIPRVEATPAAGSATPTSPERPGVGEPVVRASQVAGPRAGDRHGRAGLGADGPPASRASIRLFQFLPRTQQRHITARMSRRVVRRGERVFLVGDPAEKVRILESGRVKIVRDTDDGREVLLRLVQPGEILDGGSRWGETRHVATAVALNDGVLLELPTTEFVAVMRADPDVALTVVEELGNRLRELESRVSDLQTEDVTRRIARHVLRLAGADEADPRPGPMVADGLTREELAELCGATASTVSRVLSAWDRQGLVVAERKRVTVTRPDELARIADGDVPAARSSD